MTKFQFAGVRPKACIHSAEKSTGGTTTSAIAGNWQFYLQFRNRAGYSLLSDPVLLTLQAGDRVSFTIPADARREGEHHEEWIIAGAKSTQNIDARVLFSVPAWDEGGNPTVLPATVTLSSNEHFGLEVTVANESALPVAPLHGQRRGLLSTGQIVSYDSRSETWNPILPPRFTSYVNSAEGEGGANRDAGLLGDWQGVVYPDYDSGYPLPSRGNAIGYWLVNDTKFDIPSGTPVVFTFRAGKFTDWQNKIIITPKGYADILTGYLDRSGEGGTGLYEGIDQDFLYQKFKGEIVLEKNLPPNRAFYFEVTPQFSDSQLGNLVLQGETLTVYASFGEEVSSYAPGTYGLGDYIYPEPTSRKRIYPNIGYLSAEASPGAGLIKQREFRKSNSQIFFGFDANTANQQVVISGDGNCFLADEVPPYAVRRALAGTVDGVGKPTPFQHNLTVDSGKAVRLVISHPTAIRSNYPDVVAGSTLGEFNASKVYVYLRNISSGEILQFVKEIIPGSTSSNFAIGGLAGTPITSLPNPDNTFGLYEPVSFSATIESVSGELPTAVVEVAIAYFFENTLTSIDHTTDCIFENGGGVVEMIEQTATAPAGITAEDALVLSFGF